MFYKLKQVFSGRITVLGGPHVARGLDVAQAWIRGSHLT